MGTGADRDFAALLDDLFAAPPRAAEIAPSPVIRMDYLSVAEELHSGRIKVSPDHAAAEYREAETGHEGSFAALLANLERLAELGVAEEKLPPIDPDSIAAELGLGTGKPRVDFGRLRRDFAFANHPDRVAPHLQQRAMVRMQIANMLIDDAKRRAARSTKR
ncbi:hypothetical protein EET67_10590 [Pseudaminobacter arsenicus]|uniref:J domain-containing protein n=1 Tax=Borborobacter arsenicus TaxID=1851146 RepID=A0A432V7B6_9HYPH|nr:hypothetical protein [Pseudaminobacter arsenicus]RUM98048.1 hypothetical protein EET67_10590 [Pseudaminobacter arsenicus]